MRYRLLEESCRKNLRIMFFGTCTFILFLFFPDKSFSDSSRMEIVFLGTGGPRADGRAASCNAILIDGHPRFFVDLGSGAFTRLGELHLPLDRVDTIFLTHLHIDHTADLASMVKARAAVTDQPLHFDIFGPSGAGDYPSTSRFVELLFGQGGAWAYLKHFGALISWDAHDIPNDPSRMPSTVFETKDGVKVSAVTTHHGDAPALAYRIEFKGRNVTFSGDIDPAGLPNLEKLAAETNVLIFNCAVLDPPDSPKELYTRHSPPKLIGDVAKAAHVQRLVLTHIPPPGRSGSGTGTPLHSSSNGDADQFCRG
jgi:ribonuclease BN (tRNA processing enzyme)